MLQALVGRKNESRERDEKCDEKPEESTPSGDATRIERTPKK